MSIVILVSAPFEMPLTGYSLHTTTTTRLSEPFASAAFAKSAFRGSAAAIWNSLPSAKNSY